MTGARGQAAWPVSSAASAVLAADSTAMVPVGATHIGLGHVVTQTKEARTVGVSLLPQASSQRAGIAGPMFTFSGDLSSPTKVTLDYSSFQNLGGADWGSRLRLVELPACVLTTPTEPRCQVATALPSVNPGTGTLTATMPAAPLAPTAAPMMSTTNTQSEMALTSQTATASSATMVLAAASGPSGSNGSFAATSLASSASWSQGGSSGAFTYSYPLTVAPPGTGSDVAPQVSLAYDSSSVDGQITTSNNQSSLVGEGWDYDPGYVERTYRTCATDTTLPAASQTQDLCWAGNIVTLHLPGGPAESLVRDDTTGVWHPQNDDGERVTVATGANNGAHNGEYWVITTKSGVKYTFGLNVLPGGTTANATNSVWTVPVYGAHSTDPCYNAAGFAASSCTQAWRWNLDLVQDPNSNATAYYYTPETGYYGADNSTSPVAYTRDGYLSHIDYGLSTSSNNIYAITAPERVSFTVAERCIPSGTITCSDAQFTTANASSWPDTPVDLNCASTGTCNTHAPTFWSRKRYVTIASSYYSGTAYQNVDSYALTQSFPNTGDPEMALNKVVRTAYGAAGSTAITLPAVSFGYIEMDNRVAGYTTEPAMGHNRLISISTETGENIEVSYEGQNGQSGRAPALCTATTVPASPSTDTSECYPVYWTQPGYTTPTLDYFHHYMVTEVDQQDANGTAPTRMTTYTYVGGAAWHFDDNEVVQPAYRTYGQFRGYQEVDTRTGNPAVNVTGLGPDKWTLTRTTYFRGMNGDTLPGGTTRSVSITDSQGGTHPDTDQFAGAPLEQKVFNGDGGAQVKTTIDAYAILATTATRARTGLPALTATLQGRTSSSTYTAKAAGGNNVATTTTTFDSVGRPATATITATGAVTSCTATTYADNTTTWVRDDPSEVIAYSGACATGTKMRDTRTYYDGSATLGAVTVGNPTEVDQAKAMNGTTPVFVKTTTGYDAYGRVTSTTAYDPGLASGNRTTTTAYTPAGAGPLTQTVVTNPAGQKTTTTFDPARGKETKVTDVAGRTTSATYDALGRVTAVWKPGQTQGTNNATVTYAYQYGPTAPLAVTTKTLVDPGNGATPGYVTSISIYDAFGSLRQTQADGVGGGRAITDSYPDSHGWVVLTDGPWYTTGTPSTTPVTTAASGINDRKITTDDGTGRPVQVNDYTGTTLTSVAKTIYGGDRTTTIPPTGGTSATSIINGAGKQIELDDYKTAPTVSGNVVSGGTYNKQTFTYDALGQETARTTGATNASTAKQASWSMTYDLLGRTTKVVSPDAGTTTTTYFDTGETATTTDGAGRVVAYDYDALGRKIGEYSGSLTGTKLAAWTYDTATNGIGQIASSVSYSGGYSYTETSTGYDAAGNPTGTTLTSTDPALSVEPSYTTSEAWTTTHLLASEVLPPTLISRYAGASAETLTYWYDNHGDPNGLGGLNTYVSGATYSPYGELSQYVLGVNNSVAGLTYTRDPQTRRVTDVNFSSQLAYPQIEDAGYAYDLYGNVTKETDVQGPAGSPTETQCFSYDGLDELTQAWSATDACATDPTTLGNNSKVGGPQPYWSTWGYDDAGGRSSQVQHAVTGGGVASTITTDYTNGNGTQAHALASSTTTGGVTGSATYAYATDGALKTSTVNGNTSALTYGPTGQLASVQVGTSTSKYVHDADGNILTRTDAAGNTTLYLPGQEITISPDKTGVTTDRYYSLGGVTVAMRINRANPTYLMTDLHNTAQVAFDPVSTTVIRRYLDPFGNPLGGVSGGTWPGDHGFLGKPVNATTGLTDVGAREYDPSIGRFISVDPVLAAADPLQANGYTYANNNPMTNTDPTGLMREADPLGTWPESLPQAVMRAAQGLLGGATGGRSTPQTQGPATWCSDGRCGLVSGFGPNPPHAKFENVNVGLIAFSPVLFAAASACLPFALECAAAALESIPGGEGVATTSGLVGSGAAAVDRMLDQGATKVGVGGFPELNASRSQLEAKFKHAADFGISESRGVAGFDAYGKAVDSFVGDSSTVRVMGTYRGDPAILNYNSTSRLVVVQSTDGSFISGWQMSEAQLQNVMMRGSLGGG